MRKKQNEMTSSSKNGEYLILGRNSDFREKFGILELEMSHPGSNPRFLGTPVNFLKISFLIRALLLWEKVATAEKMKKMKNEKENKDVFSGH